MENFITNTELFATPTSQYASLVGKTIDIDSSQIWDEVYCFANGTRMRYQLDATTTLELSDEGVITSIC